MVPRANHQKMGLLRVSRMFDMSSIMRERPGLVIILASGDGQYGHRQGRILFGGRIVGIPKFVARWMREPSIKHRLGAGDALAQLLERKARLMQPPEGGRPEGFVRVQP